ncbi:ABC transporter permease [Chachezhania sediminis]|uniref:ABC transporter permease n=1 Tax=Chachezhania sediminis TaxID=2599291 RepID=UPI00131B61D0|nr:iron chelate uptake ABC transporter family permease subunit [Chachezhania sediminis]
MRLLVCLSVLAVLVGLSLVVGVIDISADGNALQILVVSRLPRTLAVVIAGAALAVSGAIMQMLVRNRFVEPMTAGTGQGAALGVLAATLLIPDAPIVVRMILAAGLALLSSLAFLAMTRRLPPTQPLLIPLVALVYGALIQAVVTFIAWQTDLLQYVAIWTTGEFSGVLSGRYEPLWIAAGVTVLCYVISDQFAIVGLGKAVSVNLGLNHDMVLLLGLLGVSIVTALTVVTVGMIPFVGLVVPNIVSRLHGDNLRATLPLTAFWGAGALLASDILARVLRFPYEIPVGTVFGVIGSVLFLWLLHARQTHVSR